MEKIFEKLFDFEKIPTKLILILWITSGILLFVPSEYQEKLNLTSFVQEYGRFMGITFLVTTAFLIITFISFFYNKIKENSSRKKNIRRIKSSVRNLTFSEIQILREFAILSKSTIQLPFLDESVISLENKMIIYKASNSGTVTMRGQFWPYSISEYAEPLINFEILSLPKEPTEKQKEKIFDERPNWTK